MGFYKTDKCFFTGKKVIRYDELDNNYLDGYYYVISFNSKEVEIRLFYNYDWDNDLWLKEHGKDFFNMLDSADEWSFFSKAKRLDDIKKKFDELKTLNKIDFL